MMPDDSGTEERVRQLAELAIIEAPLDPLFKQVCGLASAIFAMPVALVTVIDASHQHFLACHGAELDAVPRHDAICNLTIRQTEPLVIEDMSADARVRDNPFVSGGPKIRFYAGVPLCLTTGVPLGTLCLIDMVPRVLTPAQVASLQGLAALVVGQIRHHESKRELARQAMKLAQRQAMLRQTERFARVGGFEIDPLDGAMRCSDELCRLYSIEPDANPTLDTFMAVFVPEDRARLRQAFADVAMFKEHFDCDARIDDGRGQRRDVHVHAECHAMGDGTPKIIGIVQDITERKAVHDTLQWIATHDALTGICNRVRFNEHLDEAVRCADLYGQKVALFVLDVDRFKTFNDTLGHDAGDVVLCAVAQRLEAAVGARGLVARIGGDEFAVLVRRFEAEGAVAALARNILASLREPLDHEGAELSTRATFGVAFYEFDKCSAASLFKAADIALYNAKQAGRDGFAFYRSAMREELEARQDKLAKARAAVFGGKIEPFYQPKVCLATGRIVGFEALLRWLHPERGLCVPHEMGDAFADRELAVAIGRAMLYRVVEDMVDLRAKGLDFGHVALNVAEPEFYAGDYAERLISCLATHQLPHDSIEIEVTESVFLGHRSRVVVETLGKLSDAGIPIALDDFGTGFASLTHLKQYPVSTIKIDRSFVMHVETDADDATIVDALVSLGKALTLGVVAEGIETQAQLEFLQARGCTTGQGYLFAKPMPASRLPFFLRHWPGLSAEPPALERATG